MKRLFQLLLSLTCSLAFAAININTASQAELETLKGIGPAKAKAIIDYRSKNGGFKSVDDFEQVPGIGPKTVEKLRSEITVSGTTKPASNKVATGTEQIKAAPAKPAKPTKSTNKPADLPAKPDLAKSTPK